MFKKINFIEDSFIIDTHCVVNGYKLKTKLKLTFKVPDYFISVEDDADYIKKNLRRYKKGKGLLLDPKTSYVDLYIENDEIGSVGYLLRKENDIITFEHMLRNYDIDKLDVKKYNGKKFFVIYAHMPQTIYIVDITKSVRLVIIVADEYKTLKKKELKNIFDYKIEILWQEQL